MALPIQRRDFDLFLSHAHKDSAWVAQLDVWLTQAGLRVWYDAREMSGGSLLATDLQAAIERCRGAIVIASGESLAQGWVRNEYNAAMDEAARDRAFRVIALRLPEARTQELMKGTTWIDVPAEGLDADSAMKILLALYPGENRPVPGTAQDVFISCSWQHDCSSNATICRELMTQGLRLIGDARDQKGFGTDRVERLIASCGALVAIVPFRGEAEATAAAGEYRYFMREIDLALRHELPLLVIADTRVSRRDGSDAGWLRMDTDAGACPPAVLSALGALWGRWQAPPRPQYVFCAMDLDSGFASPTGRLRHLIERVTGMPTRIGTDVTEMNERGVSAAVMDALCQAFVVLADISDDNLNTCIEAGMALAARTNVQLITAGPTRRPPFMLRSLQMPNYDGEVQRLAVVHRVMRPYRRRIINTEL